MYLDKVRDIAQRLVKLTDDPQPGLFSWNVAAGRLCAEMKEAITEIENAVNVFSVNRDDKSTLL